MLGDRVIFDKQQERSSVFEERDEQIIVREVQVELQELVPANLGPVEGIMEAGSDPVEPMVDGSYSNPQKRQRVSNDRSTGEFFHFCVFSFS
jgi:hypothetical protein